MIILSTNNDSLNYSLEVFILILMVSNFGAFSNGRVGGVLFVSVALCFIFVIFFKFKGKCMKFLDYHILINFCSTY